MRTKKFSAYEDKVARMFSNAARAVADYLRTHPGSCLCSQPTDVVGPYVCDQHRAVVETPQLRGVRGERP